MRPVTRRQALALAATAPVAAALPAVAPKLVTGMRIAIDPGRAAIVTLPTVFFDGRISYLEVNGRVIFSDLDGGDPKGYRNQIDEAGGTKSVHDSAIGILRPGVNVENQ